MHGDRISIETKVSFRFQFSDELRQVVSEELNVKEILDDKEIGEGWVEKEDGDLRVALDIKITSDLRKEGLVREVVRTINQLRKEQKLTIEDRVIVEYNTSDEMLKAIFEEYSEEIKKQVLADELKKEGKNGEKTNIGGAAVVLAVHK